MFTFPYIYQGAYLPRQTMYIFGGGTTTIYAFNGQTEITTGHSMVDRWIHASASTLGDEIFIFGGFNDDVGSADEAIQKYTPWSGRSTTGINLASLQSGHASCTLGFNCFIFGGRNNSGVVVNTIQRFDGSERTTDGSVLSNAINQAPCASLGSYAYLFGGDDNTTKYTYVQKYNGSTRTTNASQFSLGTAWGSAARIGATYVYHFGGAETGTGQIDSVKKYDGTTLTSAGVSLPYVSSSTMAIEANLMAYIFGSLGTASARKYDGTTMSVVSVSFNAIAASSCGSAL